MLRQATRQLLCLVSCADWTPCSISLTRLTRWRPSGIYGSGKNEWDGDNEFKPTVQ